MIKTDKKTCVLRSKALGIRLMQDIWLGCLLAVSLWRCFRHFQLVGDPGADPEHAGGTTYLFWPGNTLGSTRRSWRTLLGWRMSGCPYSVWCNFDLVPDKWWKINGWMDGWMDGIMSIPLQPLSTTKIWICLAECLVAERVTLITRLGFKQRSQSSAWQAVKQLLIPECVSYRNGHPSGINKQTNWTGTR